MSTSVFVHVSASDNYLVCQDVSAEIFFCLSSEGVSSVTRPGLCVQECIHSVLLDSILSPTSLVVFIYKQLLSSSDPSASDLKMYSAH